MGTVAARSMIRQELQCVGFEEITVTGAAQALTVPTRAMEAICQVQGDQVRIRVDGTAPTATVGLVLDDVDVVTVRGVTDLANFQIILNSGASTAKLACQYFG